MYLNREIMPFLESWKVSKTRKSLVLHGARQVGKSSLIREFGKTFQNFVEINFERNPEFIPLFEESLEPQKLISSLSLLTGEKIDPQNTLLFFDEIQECPRAITSLRYFYEDLPELHVVGAGSLLKFQMEQEGVPVGRVEFLYMKPLSFKEFLSALGENQIVEFIAQHNLEKEVPEAVHQKILSLLKTYLVVGGMPQAVVTYLEQQDFKDVQNIQINLINTYRADFRKYAKERQIAYIEKTFQTIPRLIGQKFKYSNVSSEIRAQYISEALELLSKAGIAHLIYHSSSNGVPLSSEINFKQFKVAFLDVGLIQNALGLSLSSIPLQSADEFINRGALAEQFVAQELLAYSEPNSERKLCYWLREKRGSQAEVDYIIERGSEIIPIEVKYGTSLKAKSLQMFMKEKKSKVGYKFSSENLSHFGNIKSLPLYFVSRVVG
jgi:predicted AAA+ superfamily ATPase